MAVSRETLGQARRWVVKIGSAMITDEGRGLDAAAIEAWVAQLAELHAEGRDVIIVSSGAVAEGMRRLGWRARPKALAELQAAAAVGQMGLVQGWEAAFQKHGIRTAQILLTHEDVSDRQRYLNARNTLRTLTRLRVVPVINENDTVAFEEIRFGDNDTLGALVANLVEAELYVILTDQHGMYDRDPRAHADARFLSEVSAGDPALERMAGGGAGTLGRGGMLTKVRAAAKAARSGTATLLAWGREPEVLRRVARGEPIGTLLRPQAGPVAARKQWLAVQLQVRGWLHLDAGAVQALKLGGRSLLAVGVRGVEGEFQRGELVACVGPDGVEVARGLVNYDASESVRIMGKPTEAIESVLGYVDAPALIHRDDLVLV
ncbi:glutamate 5-kinase [Plasticicumulans sp.]|uniref:glutamate 5-kinase n=4 Tax=Plasticicumulans sp. TaxID=2307179 RepID=UPI000F9FEF80|nr:glutamate 5-kinase [Plasticicumulans sp.]MBS0603111.1 glutamate 5-kinase [Pseudomonadota bacterium]RTK96910.1 MAG: glutamate 5-kinase [Xanthomonadales bacterium]HNF64693.1 glutamate 5-kinase [Plasticicumulans sp.]HNG48489.1 glutamate 5-kinase [Plasticicumulans sp.]HNM42064.1 glutamate 5-kinase [Plasticicumulans sp.]